MLTDKLWQGACVALAVAVLSLGGYSLHLRSNLKTVTDEKIAQKSQWDSERGQSKEALTTLQEKFNKVSEARKEEAKINDQKVKDEQDKTATAVAAGADLRDRLRVSTQKYASLSAQFGSGPAPQPGSTEYSSAVAGLERRAQALGGLLERCDALSERLATDAEGLATQVRGLQAQYHSLEKK